MKRKPLTSKGDAKGFFRALCHTNPIGIKACVPPAALRQANCYYSSSDAACADRYQAYDEYRRVMKGEIRSREAGGSIPAGRALQPGSSCGAFLVYTGKNHVWWLTR